MILDIIENAHLYCRLGNQYRRAFEFIGAADFSGYEDGVYEIEGKDLMLKIQQYNTRPPEKCKIELHRKYADIHFIITGEELFGYIHKRYCTSRLDYDVETDMEIVLSEGMGYALQRKGCFAIAFPEDAHQSACMHKVPCRVKKALMKVRL